MTTHGTHKVRTQLAIFTGPAPWLRGTAVMSFAAPEVVSFACALRIFIAPPSIHQINAPCARLGASSLSVLSHLVTLCQATLLLLFLTACSPSVVCRVACQIHPTNMYLLLAVTPSVTPVRYASSAHQRYPMSMYRPRRRRRRRRRSHIYVTLICFRALLFHDVISRLV